jgi:MFS transporter, DHA1 family, multidrug resistance protein
VIARAVVRDLHTGVAAARFFALLMLVSGLAPILARSPVASCCGSPTGAASSSCWPGSGGCSRWPPGGGWPRRWRHRRGAAGGWPATLRTFGGLMHDRALVGYALVAGLAFAAMSAYIAGSPFVLENVYGASPQAFSLRFGGNALGIMVCSQVGRAVVRRTGPARVLTMGVRLTAIGGLGALASVVLGLGLAGLVPSLFVLVSSIGLVLPNAAALAMAEYPLAAGSASALIGLAQFGTGALAAPLAGVGGADTALPMGIVMAVLPLAGLACLRMATRASGPPPQAVARRPGRIPA